MFSPRTKQKTNPLLTSLYFYNCSLLSFPPYKNPLFCHSLVGQLFCRLKGTPVYIFQIKALRSIIECYFFLLTILIFVFDKEEEQALETGLVSFG